MDLTDRNIRQRDIVPPDKLAKIVALIVGVGAVGRQLALQFATMGVSTLYLVDPQDVDVENLGAQGFREKDLGKTKIDAVTEAVVEINSTILVCAHAARFQKEHVPDLDEDGKIVVCSCVDDMNARRKIWRAARLSHLFMDSRMGAEVARVITVADSKGEQYYPKTLFSQSEMYQEPCTAKTTIYCASIQAGMMAAQFTKWLRGFPVSMDMVFNILSGDITYDLVEDISS